MEGRIRFLTAEIGCILRTPTCKPYISTMRRADVSKAVIDEMRRFADLRGDILDINEMIGIPEDLRDLGIQALVKAGYLDVIDQGSGLYQLNLELLRRPCLH